MQVEEEAMRRSRRTALYGWTPCLRTRRSTARSQKEMQHNLSLCLSFLLLGTFSSTVTAQTVDDQTNPQSESADNVLPTFDPRFGIGYTTQGAGFDPFASYEVFVPL